MSTTAAPIRKVRKVTRSPESPPESLILPDELYVTGIVVPKYLIVRARPAVLLSLQLSELREHQLRQLKAENCQLRVNKAWWNAYGQHYLPR